LDEISFYQERFKAVVDVIEEAKKQGFKRPRIQA
jgi:RNAse (barnase) inhibitor barstar